MAKKDKNVTQIDATEFEARVKASGLRTTDRAGWLRVDGVEPGHRLYVAKTKKVSRVDLVGLDGEGTVALAKPAGKVTHRLRFDLDQQSVLASFEKLLVRLSETQTGGPMARTSAEESVPEQTQMDLTEATAAKAPEVGQGDDARTPTSATAPTTPSPASVPASRAPRAPAPRAPGRAGRKA